MREIGKTYSGTVIVEMSRDEWAELNALTVTEEIRIIASRYNEYRLCDLLLDIFGGGDFSVPEILEMNVDHIFSSRMTMALHSLSKEDREVVEMFYGLLDDRMALREIDLKMQWEPGQAQKRKTRALRQLRHPNIGRGLRKYVRT